MHMGPTSLVRLQPYSIAPPNLHEQHPAHAAFFNLSLVAADEEKASEYAHPVHCNALEMRLASTYVACAFDGTVKVCWAWRLIRTLVEYIDIYMNIYSDTLSINITSHWVHTTAHDKPSRFACSWVASTHDCFSSTSLCVLLYRQT